MSSTIFGKALVKPGAVAPGRRAVGHTRVSRSPRRLVVSASSAENHGVTGRRQVLSGSVLGLGLSAGNAVFAEMLESPETTPDAIIMEESVSEPVLVMESDVVEVEAADVTANEIEETVSDVVEEGGDSSVPLDTADPLVLGGGAAAVVAAVGAAAATTQNSDESTPVADVINPWILRESKLKELEAAKEERNDRHAALAALHQAVAKASEGVSKASVAHGAAFESLMTASEVAAATEFEAQMAQMEYDKAKAAFDEASAKNGVSKMFMGLFGKVSVDALESDATEAEFKARSTRLLAREATLVDRRAWIASWRATDDLALATSDFQAKNAELGAVAALAHEAERNVETIMHELEIIEEEAARVPAPAKTEAGIKAPVIAKGLEADAWRGDVTAQITASVEPATVEAKA